MSEMGWFAVVSQLSALGIKEGKWLASLLRGGRLHSSFLIGQCPASEASQRTFFFFQLILSQAAKVSSRKGVGRQTRRK